MDLNFYSELPGGSPSNVDSDYLNGQAYGGYPEENKVTLKFVVNKQLKQFVMWLLVGSSSANKIFQFSEGGDSYLTISGQGHHPFLSAAVSCFRPQP